MKTFDNHGKLRSEITTSYTQDGKVVTTNTLYNANGQVVSQHIAVRDAQGRVKTETTYGGKLLP